MRAGEQWVVLDPRTRGDRVEVRADHLAVVTVLGECGVDRVLVGDDWRVWEVPIAELIGRPSEVVGLAARLFNELRRDAALLAQRRVREPLASRNPEGGNGRQADGVGGRPLRVSLPWPISDVRPWCADQAVARGNRIVITGEKWVAVDPRASAEPDEVRARSLVVVTVVEGSRGGSVVVTDGTRTWREPVARLVNKPRGVRDLKKRLYAVTAASAEEPPGVRGKRKES